MERIIPDAAVVTFLASKGVEASPPKARTTGSKAFEGLITGMTGPLVGGVNHLANNQRGAAALAEWTSWKQWALSHQEWPHWYQHEWPRVAVELELRVEEQRSSEKTQYEQQKLRRRESSTQILQVVVVLVAGFVIVGFIGSLVENSLNRNRDQEQSTKVEEESYTYSNPRCEEEFQRLKGEYRSRSLFNKTYGFMGCDEPSLNQSKETDSEATSHIDRYRAEDAPQTSADQSGPP